MAPRSGSTIWLVSDEDEVQRLLQRLVEDGTVLEDVLLCSGVQLVQSMEHLFKKASSFVGTAQVSALLEVCGGSRCSREDAGSSLCERHELYQCHRARGVPHQGIDQRCLF